MSKSSAAMSSEFRAGGVAISLSPTQHSAFQSAIRALDRQSILVLWGDGGRGKSSVLRELHAHLGGGLVQAADVVERVREGHPLALEEGFLAGVLKSLASHDIVFVDDMESIVEPLQNCHSNPRCGWFSAVAMSLVAHVLRSGKKLILAGGSNLPDVIRQRAEYVKVERLKAEDYAHICSAWLPADKCGVLDFAKVHRFAPNLTGHQLRDACAWLGQAGEVSTESAIEYLRSQRLATNVALDEVTAVDLRSLRGVDDVIEALETHVVLPMEHDEMTARFGLRPKRGVLLAGPPGTGKTTIGRALARRLRGKFLLVDGTVIAGTRDFYQRISEIFRTAQENAPSIIFIDDGDVLFEDKEQLGLYRYLLTKLDGLESEKTGHVCVMMTAMDVGSLPAALVRSGRIELWLQMRLPDEAARAAILGDLLDGQRGILGDFDSERAVSATHDFTGADLKRTVEDAKLLMASDLARGSAQSALTDYLLRAAEAARQNKQLYAEAIEQSKSKQGDFDPARNAWRYYMHQEEEHD